MHDVDLLPIAEAFCQRAIAIASPESKAQEPAKQLFK